MLNISTYLTPGEDSADAIQAIIDANPHKTIYFPDGEYLLSHPICTPADPEKSVALELDNYAILRAAPGWSSDEAMVRLGGKDPFNTIYVPGSNYYIRGGIVDGAGVAKGISVDSGRESRIEAVSIKNVQIGIHIKPGANSNSSDVDILNVNITGNGKTDSIGVLLEGHDNTLTNMRIAAVQVGIYLKSAGNSMRNLHPLYTCGYEDYAHSYGFYDVSNGNNWYNFCYSDHFGTGFYTSENTTGFYDSCFTMWYSGRPDFQHAFESEGEFKAAMSNFTIGFHPQGKNHCVLKVGKPGGKGFIGHLACNTALSEDKSFEAYLK